MAASVVALDVAPALAAFAARLPPLLVVGAPARSLALRWLMPRMDIAPTFGGWNYALEELEYQLGLPYNYFMYEV